MNVKKNQTINAQDDGLKDSLADIIPATKIRDSSHPLSSSPIYCFLRDVASSLGGCFFSRFFSAMDGRVDVGRAQLAPKYGPSRNILPLSYRC